MMNDSWLARESRKQRWALVGWLWCISPDSNSKPDKEKAVFEKNTFLIFSPLSRRRGRGNNCYIFLRLMALARRIIMVTKYNMPERHCQYQDNLRWLCSFLLPIFTHCMSFNLFQFLTTDNSEKSQYCILCCCVPTKVISALFRIRWYQILL